MHGNHMAHILHRSTLPASGFRRKTPSASTQKNSFDTWTKEQGDRVAPPTPTPGCSNILLIETAASTSSLPLHQLCLRQMAYCRIGRGWRYNARKCKEIKLWRIPDIVAEIVGEGKTVLVRFRILGRYYHRGPFTAFGNFVSFRYMQWDIRRLIWLEIA